MIEQFQLNCYWGNRLIVSEKTHKQPKIMWKLVIKGYILRIVWLMCIYKNKQVKSIVCIIVKTINTSLSFKKISDILLRYSEGILIRHLTLGGVPICIQIHVGIFVREEFSEEFLIPNIFTWKSIYNPWLYIRKQGKFRRGTQMFKPSISSDSITHY